MEQFISRHGFKLILGLLALIVLFVVLFTQLGSSRAADFPLKEEAPDFELTDIDGSTVSISSTNGKPRLVYFYYSNCPDVCQPTTQLLVGVQNVLKDEGEFGNAELISITFDPKRDTRERLIEFTEMHGADRNGWYFLRGDEQYTHDLAFEYGLWVEEQEDGIFGHSNLIFLLDKDGFIRKYYPIDLDLMPEHIYDDLKALM